MSEQSIGWQSLLLQQAKGYQSWAATAVFRLAITNIESIITFMYRMYSIIQHNVYTCQDIKDIMKVVHCKKEPYDVYIGRPSKWGNPYIIGEFGTREECVAEYTHYLESNPELLAALLELRGKTLGCWCSPHSCHGDILMELANK